jgi:hypothetical protein
VGGKEPKILKENLRVGKETKRILRDRGIE